MQDEIGYRFGSTISVPLYLDLVLSVARGVFIIGNK